MAFACSLHSRCSSTQFIEWWKGSDAFEQAHHTGFLDSTFAADHVSLCMSEEEVREGGIVWRRAPEVFEGAALLPEVMAYDQVIQGRKHDW